MTAKKPAEGSTAAAVAAATAGQAQPPAQQPAWGAPAASAPAQQPAAPPPPPPPPPVALRTDGPTLAQYVKAGYPAENYPPAGYAVREDSAASVGTVLMKRDPEMYPSPYTADVHPDEVENFKAAGFVVDED